MATEAHENLMLAAIGDELAKIGTAPLSNWVTQEQPDLRLGPPGNPRITLRAGRLSNREERTVY